MIANSERIIFTSITGSKYQSNLNEINKSEQKSVVAHSAENNSKNDSLYHSDNSAKSAYGKHIFENFFKCYHFILRTL